jgi:hypothetical protein
MFTQFLHFLKMGWMFTWRILLVSVVFRGGRFEESLILVAFIVAGVLAFGFNKTFVAWPLLRLFRGRTLIRPADTWGDGDTPSKLKRPTGDGVTPPRAGVVLGSATTNGRITGFEPSALAAQPVPRNGRNMLGVPGSGLHGATGMTQTNIELGVKGEENFAKALALTGGIDRFGTVWSVPVPDQIDFVPGPYGTDIDCVLSTNSTVFLIDLKNYKSGNVRYTSNGSQLHCVDVATGNQIGDDKTMSRNMEMATSAVRNHFPQANVVPVVVFMPTDKGEGVLDNVVWSGGIPAMNLTDFLSMLGSHQNFDWKQSQAGVISMLGRLLPRDSD